MKQSDFNNILLHLLVNLQSSVQANRDLLLDIVTSIPESPVTDLWKKKMKDRFDEWGNSQKDYTNALIAGIRNNYDPNLGSIDDLLSVVEPDS